MQTQSRPPILSAEAGKLWRPIQPLIWGTDRHAGDDAARSILRTLFDQPRWLEPYLLYDELGSQLFETICTLPEYYLTRTESSILARDAGRIIAAAPVSCIVELGAGTSRKTMYLLSEQARQRQGGIFAPIDVNLSSLAASRDAARERFPQIEFYGLRGRYEEGISSVRKELPTLFLFLGSSVGNFTHPEFVGFFRFLSESMGPEDFLLLGVDRVKEAAVLERAYADAQGVTARFILNAFRNINRFLQGNFDLAKMRYECVYNPQWQRVEMYAVSTATQVVELARPGASFVWEKGEKILVEISRKFEPERLQQQLRFFGLTPLEHFTDPKEWFSLLLFRKSR